MQAVRRHYKAWLLATSLVAVFAVVFARCGGATCGDGKKEGDEECDVGKNNGAANSGCSADCQIASLHVAPLNINITRLQNEAVGYTGATCTDLQVASMHVVLNGPGGWDRMLDCATQSSYLISDITPGQYTVTVTLLGSGNVPLTNPLTSAAVTAATDTTAEIALNFAMKDFVKQDYTGVLFFNPSWGEDNTTCTMANPAVTGYGVMLRDPSGKVVTGVSTGNRTFDGTMGPCFVPSSNGTAEASPSMPWGHYTISFTGYAGQSPSFCGSFDVFNGPSKANSTYALTVPGVGDDAGACDL
jgi:hypothetical protein